MGLLPRNNSYSPRSTSLGTLAGPPPVEGQVCLPHADSFSPEGRAQGKSAPSGRTGPANLQEMKSPKLSAPDSALLQQSPLLPHNQSEKANGQASKRQKTPMPSDGKHSSPTQKEAHLWAASYPQSRPTARPSSPGSTSGKPVTQISPSLHAHRNYDTKKHRFLARGRSQSGFALFCVYCGKRPDLPQNQKLADI